MRTIGVALTALVLATAARAEPLVLGSFEATLPCADCPGVRTVLTLTRKGEHWAEGTYRLEEARLGGGAPKVTTGDWTTLRGDAADPDAVVYELNPDRPGAGRWFVKQGEGRIQPLDATMRPIVGASPWVRRP